MEKKMSRASIINFLKTMAEMNVLKFDLRSGKGGMRRIYYPAYSESELKIQIIRDTFNSFLNDFPNETRKVIEEFRDTDAITNNTKQPASNNKKRSLKDLFER